MVELLPFFFEQDSKLHVNIEDTMIRVPLSHNNKRGIEGDFQPLALNPPPLLLLCQRGEKNKFTFTKGGVSSVNNAQEEDHSMPCGEIISKELPTVAERNFFAMIDEAKRAK